MATLDQILLGFLLVALAAFPVAIFLYLRTAYQKHGWPEVKTAALVAVIALAIPLVLRIWLGWEFSPFLARYQTSACIGQHSFRHSDLAGASRPETVDRGDA